MGTWGYGIFQDDLASEMRAEWKRLYAAFQDPARAAEELLATWHDSLDDPDIGPELWVAMAVLKHQYGCLDEPLRSKALRIMESGEGLTLWEDQGPKEVAARRKTYATVTNMLLSPQPPLKKTKQRPLQKPPFKPGDLVCYTFLTGVKVLMWVRDYLRYQGERLPRFIPLDWHGTSLPTEAEIRRLRPKLLECSLWRMRLNREILLDKDEFEPDYLAETEKLVAKESRRTCTMFCLRGFDDPFVPRDRVEVVPGTWEWKFKTEPDPGIISRWFMFETEGYHQFRLEPPDEWPRPSLQRRTDLDKLKPSAGPLRAPPAPPDGPQPRPRGVTHEYVLSYLGRSGISKQPGDLHAMHVRGRGWIFARTIRTDAGSLMGPCLLLYVYGALVQSGEPVPPLSPHRLLFPPILTMSSTPNTGYSVVIERRALLPQDVLQAHCFGSYPGKYFIDEFDRPLKRRIDPCGEIGRGGTATLDAMIATALGIPINWY